MTTETNWGYNCLTDDVHHGRPEELWNIPLLHARRIFKVDELQAIVVARIYNDAMELVDASPFVQKGTEYSYTFTEEWAEKVRDHAKETFVDILNGKVDELNKYYDSPEWHLATYGVIKHIKKEKLNANYAPLHFHDSINMLCRIVGKSSDMAVKHAEH